MNAPLEDNESRGVHKLADTLVENGFTIVPSRKATVGEVLVARRADWRLTAHLHTFVVVFASRHLSSDRARERAAGAQQLAISEKGGLPRGLQTGTITFPTFVADDPARAVVSVFLEQPKQRYAAMTLPVLADLSTRQLTWFRGRLDRGFMFQEYLHHVVQEVIAPGLGCKS